jgi:GR25 family glycosyltransferase involved in LPS biosynthesis
MLNKFVDKVYIINLPERTDRLKRTVKELQGQGINEFEVFPAIKNNYGRLGIYLTFYKLMEQAYFSDLNKIAVFEDDVKFVFSLSDWLSNCMGIFNYEHEKIYDILYLGCNTHDPNEGRKPFNEASLIQYFPSKYDKENPGIRGGFIEVNDVYSCHAMIITRQGMYQILKAMNAQANYGIVPNTFGQEILVKNINFPNALDVLIQQEIQPLGLCYATFPMICTQYSGYSDIENKEMNQDYIVDRFKKNVEKFFNQ